MDLNRTNNMGEYTIDSLIQDALFGQNECSKHGIVLYSLVCSLNAKNILELGVRHGGSTRPLLMGAATTNGKLTSVDIDQPRFHPNQGADWPPQELRSRWNFVQSDAIKFLENANEKYDLIFVDDWHGSEHVYTELTLLQKNLSDRTLILLHDLMHTSRDPYYNKDHYSSGEFIGTGPYGGVMKFINEHPDYEFATIPVNHGLTILRKVI